jgi:cytochrome c
MKPLSITLLACAILPIAYSAININAESPAAENQSGSTERGKILFEKRCSGCHSLDQASGREGPPLRDVYHRNAGSVSTFKYSSALQSAQILWDDDSLNKWLIDPEKLVPGTMMDFQVSNAEERAQIIRFLRLTSGGDRQNRK